MASVMNLLQKIIDFFKPTPEPVRELKYKSKDEENQVFIYEVFEDGKFVKELHMHYFTREQFDELRDASQRVYEDYDNKK